MIENLQDINTQNLSNEQKAKFYAKFVDASKLNEQKYNINKISDDEMKLLGLTKKEIKDIKILREKGEIRSNIDLKEIFSEKRYSEIERSIEFEGE